MRRLTLLLSAIILSFTVSAQSTFSRVYDILQTNCTGTCHGGAAPLGGLDLSGSEQDVYDALVNVTPQNVGALGKDYKLVNPGYYKRSFLMQKIAHQFDYDLELSGNEGGVMPPGGTPLDDVEIELVRQWIIGGANMTDTMVNEQVLIDYYSGKALANIQRPQTPEQEGVDGYQLHIGPIFLAPFEEKEWFKKEPIYFGEDKDGTRMDLFMNGQSHHYVVYELNKSQSALLEDELILVRGPGDGTVVHLSGKQLGGWDSNQDLELPEGTAFKWNDTTYFVHNYHLLNYDGDSILRAEAFLNVYHETQSNDTREMLIKTANFGGINPYILTIPPTQPGQTFTETMRFYEQGSADIWDVWRFRGHTHSLGKDFDCWKWDAANNTKGDQVYEGQSSWDHSFTTGYWDFEHASTRTFDPFLEVNANEGLYMEAVWENNTGDTVGFGLTTSDEMFAGIVMYTKQETATDIEELNGVRSFGLYPNPTSGLAIITVPDHLNERTGIRIFDVAGKEVYRDNNVTDKHYTFDTNNLKRGIYLVELQSEQTRLTQKLIVQ